MLENQLDTELESLLAKLRARVALLIQIEDLVKAYAANEPLPPDLPVSKRRGRKSMGAEERAVVAERMKRYWASKRKPKES